MRSRVVTAAAARVMGFKIVRCGMLKGNVER
jgi:hypothetical protein